MVNRPWSFLVDWNGCAQFLLPYILIYVLCHGTSEHQKEIHDEIDAIIGKKHAFKIYEQFTLNTSFFYSHSCAISISYRKWKLRKLEFKNCQYQIKHYLHLKYIPFWKLGTEQERSHRVTTLNGSILAEQKQNIIAQDLGILLYVLLLICYIQIVLKTGDFEISQKMFSLLSRQHLNFQIQ